MTPNRRYPNGYLNTYTSKTSCHYLRADLGEQASRLDEVSFHCYLKADHTDPERVVYRNCVGVSYHKEMDSDVQWFKDLVSNRLTLDRGWSSYNGWAVATTTSTWVDVVDLVRAEMAGYPNFKIRRYVIPDLDHLRNLYDKLRHQLMVLRSCVRSEEDLLQVLKTSRFMREVFVMDPRKYARPDDLRSAREDLARLLTRDDYWQQVMGRLCQIRSVRFSWE